MFQRKKYTDFFPNLLRKKTRENSLGRTQKYEIVGSCSVYAAVPSQLNTVINIAPDAKVLAFKIDINSNKCKVTVDFKNLACYNEFKQVCPESLRALLTPIKLGVLAEEKKREIDHLPHTQPISYSAKIYSSVTSDCQDKQRAMVDNILISIHKIDPFDITIIRKLEADFFSFFNLNSIKAFLEIEKDLRKKLDGRRGCGNVMGLFTKAELLPAELGAMVGEYINNNKDRLNMALTCKQAYEVGIQEEAKEAEAINKNIRSLTF